MITASADLRVRCAQIGHALGDKLHDGDRWMAAAAVRLGVPVVSHDGVFDGAAHKGPHCVVIDNTGAVYVTDEAENRVFKLQRR